MIGTCALCKALVTAADIAVTPEVPLEAVSVLRFRSIAAAAAKHYGEKHPEVITAADGLAHITRDYALCAYLGEVDATIAMARAAAGAQGIAVFDFLAGVVDRVAAASPSSDADGGVALVR